MSVENICVIGKMPRIAYTTTEAAAMLSISRSTLYALAKQGAISPLKLGSATRWRHDDLIRLANGAQKETSESIRSLGEQPA